MSAAQDRMGSRGLCLQAACAFTSATIFDPLHARLVHSRSLKVHIGATRQRTVTEKRPLIVQRSRIRTNYGSLEITGYYDYAVNCGMIPDWTATGLVVSQ